MRVSVLLVFLLAASSALAQSPAPAPVPPGSIRTHIQGIDIPAIPNAPFTAKETVTWTQPLVGGASVTRIYYTRVARDAEGRVHRETRYFAPGGANVEAPLRSITVTDPVAGTRTVCRAETMACSIASWRPALPSASAANGVVPVSGGQVTRQSLGNQTIDDLTAVGTRETLSTVSGSHANSRLVLSHWDVWYSPDLQIDLSVTHTNPELGTVTLTLTNLQRVKPDRTWFAVPAGFTVSSAPAPQRLN
ncbi:MAG: hypothetical protein WBG54_22815 [Acidobacteriaceae bacterium]